MRKLVRLNVRQRGWLLIALAVYFTFLGGTFYTDHYLWPRIFHHMFLSTLLGGWLVSRMLKGLGWPRTSMDLPLTLFFLIAALATLFGVDPRVSIEELWRLGTHILMFYVIVDLIRSYRPRTVFQPLFFASSVVILVGFIEFLSWYAGIPPLPFFPQSWLATGGLSQPIPPFIHRLSFTLNVSTFLSAYMALLIPIGLAWLLSTHSGETRRAMILWLAGAVIIEILSFSRGGLLSLGVSLSSLALLTIVGLPRWRSRFWQILRDRRVWVAGTIFVTVAGMVMLTWARQAYADSHRAGDIYRQDLWRSAWQIGLEHPVLGAGPYGFGRMMRHYRDPAITPDHFITPHNVPLYTWAEMGGLGVLALLGLVMGLVQSGIRRGRTTDGAERIRVTAAFAALLGFSMHNLFDTFTGVTSVMVPAMVLLAYLVYPLEPVPAQHHAMQRLTPVVVLCLLVLAAIGWAVSDLAQFHFENANAALNDKQYDEALGEIDRARHIDSAMGIYAAQRAQILGEMAIREPELVPQALEAYDTALEFEGTYDLNLANYAKLLAEAGELEVALSNFQRAADARPHESRYHLWVAQTAAALGDEARALGEYRTALDMDVRIAPSDYWMADNVRTKALMQYLGENNWSEIPRDDMAWVPHYCWRFLNPDEPIEIREHVASDQYCEGLIALRLNGAPEAALEALDRALELDADHGEYYAERASAYLAVGDVDAATRDASYAIFFGASQGYYVMGQIAEQRGNIAEAVKLYQAAGPIVVQLQGWDVAVYGRRGNLRPLDVPQFDAPGPPRYDFAAWLALMRLYDSLGDHDASRRVRRAIESLDPYLHIESTAYESDIEWLIPWLLCQHTTNARIYRSW